jgi:hypothetical protein
MTQSFFVPGPIPGMNDYISTGNRFRYNSHKKKWTQVIAFYVRESRVKPVGSVYLRFQWIEKNKRRDPDNFSSLGRKWTLDALVTCKILTNDGWGQVLGWEDPWSIKGDPGVWVTLEERL